MFKKLFIASLFVVAPTLTMAQEYEVPLPNKLPFTEIDNWMMNHAISDQVCQPLPDFCLSALTNKQAIISSARPYSLTMINGSLHVKKAINITGIFTKELKPKKINYGTLKVQLDKLELPSEQFALAYKYLSEES